MYTGKSDCSSNAAEGGKCDMDNTNMGEDKQALITQKRKLLDDHHHHQENQVLLSSSELHHDRPWANGLPTELTEKILQGLPMASYAYFLAVCRPWKEIAMPQYLQPYLCNLPCNRWLCDPWLVNVKNCKTMYVRHPFFDERFCVGSSHGWCILKKRQSCNVCVMNLFNGARFSLPHWDPRLFGGSTFLSSSPATTAAAAGNSCSALVIGKYVSGGLAYCRIGDSKWSMPDKPYLIFNQKSSPRGVLKEYLDQAVALSEKFYVLTSLGRLLCVDGAVRDPRIINVSVVGENEVVPRREVFKYYPYLVESEGQILLVFVCIPGSVRALDHVEVFRFDFEYSSAWVPVEKLGGRTLYVGFNCSFSVPSEKDYVFFVDNSSDGWRVFDVEKKEVTKTQHFYSRSPSDVKDRIWILPTLDS